MRFGRLTVERMIYKKGEHTKAVCKCDCGNTIEVVATYLTSGDTTSCGCYKAERIMETNTKDFSGMVSDYGVEFICQDYKNNKKQWMWKCRCGICGNEFTALPAKVLNGHITSCGCAKSSSGERYLESVLINLDIEYIREYKFSDCRNINPLPFDFYIPDRNTVIEYQGKQHYDVVPLFGGDADLAVRKRNDSIKKKYCETNNIQLLELPYTLSNEEIKNKIQTLFIRRDCNG